MPLGAGQLNWPLFVVIHPLFVVIHPSDVCVWVRVRERGRGLTFITARNSVTAS